MTRWGTRSVTRCWSRRARAIRSALRLEDSVGRWGGEEFLAVLPSTDAKGALSTAQRIRARVAEAESLAFDGDGLEPVTVTVGGAVWVSGDIDSLIKRADRALYAGKDAGRDTVVIGRPRRSPTWPHWDLFRPGSVID